MKLDFDQLVREFHDNLHTKLRNFGLGPAFLEMWVPEEDTGRSLLGLIEAAQIAELSEPLEITLSPNLAKKIDRMRLEMACAPLGKLEWKTQETQTILVVQLLKTAHKFTPIATRQLQKNSKIETQISKRATPKERIRLGLCEEEECDSIHPVYAEAIQKIKTVHHEALPTGGADRFSAQLTLGGLTCEISKDRKVTSATHQNAKGVYRILLDQFCEVIVGKTIQEASEHGVIRLENRLRDPDSEAPVCGIVSPENADPVFLLPTQLIRNLYKEFLNSNGLKPDRNFWVDRLSSNWLKLPDSERKTRIQKALSSAIQDLGLESIGAVETVAILNDTRVILSCPTGKGKNILGSALIRLERYLQEHVEPSLELLLETFADRNKRTLRNPPPGQKSHTDENSQSAS